jgi:hypothetical protein
MCRGATHERIHVGQEDLEIVNRALQDLALVHIGQDAGQALERDSPFALQVGVPVLGVLTDKDADAGGEQADGVVRVGVDDVLR